MEILLQPSFQLVQCDNIFQNELNSWNTGDKNWPVKRTFKLFKEWFNYEIHDMILDMEDDEIIKD